MSQETKKQGIIVKGLGGFYYVYSEGLTYTCSLRGRLKKREDGVLTGDRVMFSAQPETQKNSKGELQGVVEDVLPRSNELVRPKIANVNQGLIILAAVDPDPDFMLLERLLVLMQNAGITPVICFNKLDLLAADSPVREEIADYEAAGFPLLLASAETGLGQEAIADVLSGKITVLAGPSGSGKSSTLNLQEADFELVTGEVSEKLGRGKHTTRCVELLPLDGGWVADTPGFSRLDLPKTMAPEELAQFYPEFKRHAENCRFDGCMHNREPECAVKAALAAGELSERRYKRYLMLLDELLNRVESY